MVTVRLLFVMLIISTFQAFFFVDGRRSRGGRQRESEYNSFSGGGYSGGNYDQDTALKGLAANLRSMDERSGREFLSGRERKAVNTAIHFHDHHDPEKEIPHRVKQSIRSAQQRAGLR